MNKTTVAAFVAILCFTNIYTEYVDNSVIKKSSIQTFKKRLRKALNNYIVSPIDTNLKKLKGILPSNSQKDTAMNNAAIKILKEKKRELKKIKNNIESLIYDQKNIDEKWENY